MIETARLSADTRKILVLYRPNEKQSANVDVEALSRSARRNTSTPAQPILTTLCSRRHRPDPRPTARPGRVDLRHDTLSEAASDICVPATGTGHAGNSACLKHNQRVPLPQRAFILVSVAEAGKEACLSTNASSIIFANNTI
jgi:hypothetical protein